MCFLLNTNCTNRTNIASRYALAGHPDGDIRTIVMYVYIFVKSVRLLFPAASELRFVVYNNYANDVFSFEHELHESHESCKSLRPCWLLCSNENEDDNENFGSAMHTHPDGCHRQRYRQR